MKTAKQVIQRIKTIAVKEVGGVHFDHEEAAKLIGEILGRRVEESTIDAARRVVYAP